jgi:hypothetical protein
MVVWGSWRSEELWYMPSLGRCSSTRWHVRADRVLELCLFVHGHSALKILSLYTVVCGLQLGVVLGVVLDLMLQPLNLSLCGPLFDPPLRSGGDYLGVFVEPSWSVCEAYVAVDISLVLELR